MNPDTELQQVNIIDLLSERESIVRRVADRAWEDADDIKISNSEWYVLAKIYQKQPPISHVTKSVDISRQAIHKLIKNLAAKGLVEIEDMEDNRKEKRIRLTELGEACYEKNEAVKARLEERIAETLGPEQFRVLKAILKADWGI